MDSSDDEGIIIKHKSGKKNMFNESDDEEEIISSSKSLFTLLKPNDLYDAEESDDETQTPAVVVDDKKKQLSKKNDLFDDSGDEDEGHGSMEDKNEPEPVSAFKRLQQSDLYDADDSEDENHSIRRDSDNDEPVLKSSFNISRNGDDREKTKKPKKRVQSDRKSMTNAVQQIHSETQRLVRESRISLPYHIPRQRTLAEFLQRRRSLPSTSVNLTSENVGQVWKQLEEREKEAEEFYKSDSEESETDNVSKNPDSNDASNTETIPAADNTVSETSLNCITADKIEALNRVCKNLSSELSRVSDENVKKICVTPVNTEDVQHRIEDNEASILACDNQNREISSISTDSVMNDKSVMPIECADVQDRVDNRELLTNACKDLNSELANIATDTGVNKNSDDVPDTEDLQERNVNNSCDKSDSSQSKSCSAIVDDNQCDCTISTDNIERNISDPKKNSNISKTTNSSVFDGIPKGVSSSFNLQENSSSTDGENKTEMKPPATTRVLKKMESFMMDENACIDGETAKPPLMRLSSESISENISDGSRTAGDTCDFHLHYSESQSEDAVPWYENLHPPSPEEEPEAEVVKEVKETQTPDPSSDLVTTDEKNDMEPDDKLKQLARWSLPGLGDIARLKPRLSGAPNEVINLDDEDDSAAAKSGVIQLIQRFMNHSTKKRQPKKKEHVEIGVVTVDSQDIVHKDVVSVTLEGDTPEEDPLLAKPGAKLQKLKQQLQQQMCQRRSEEHKKRMKEKKVDSGELSDSSLYDELDEVDKLDELDADIETETEEEEEEEEEDVPIVEKKRVKSAFVEDEADVSDDCDDLSSDEDELANDSGIDGNDDKADDDKLVKKSSSALQQKMPSDDDSSSHITSLSMDKKVIPESGDLGVVSDSMCDNDKQESENETQNISSLVPMQDVNKKSTSELMNTQDSMCSKSSFDTDKKLTLESFNTQDSLCTRSAADNDKMESETEVEESQSDIADTQRTKLERIKTFDMFMSQEFDHLTPYQPQRQETTPYSNRSDTQKKRVWDFFSPARCTTKSVSSSPIKRDYAPSCNKPRQLFTETEPEKSQNFDELLDLCSGQFSNSVNGLIDKEKSVNHNELEDELVGLCSGKFTTQPERSLTQEKDVLPPLPAFSAFRKDSGDSSQVVEDSSRATSVHSLEEADTQPTKFPLDADNDDDDDGEIVKGAKTHKRRRQLEYSDEESNGEDEADDKLDDENDGEDKLIGYDSDGNEVEVDYDSEENEVPRAKRAKEFFENEAELSESEWGSADEDEKDLDTLEWEEGDDDALDQHKVKEQLNKIHMRRQLDDDRREVRLLQEILLEDGELHSEGGGRERKFRWRNVDNVDDSNLPRRDSDNEGGEDGEVEDEEEWRRQRHEREMVLQKQKKDDEDLIIEEDSQIFRLGIAALKRMNSQDPPPLKRSVSEPSPDAKRPFKLLTKRGSFLARGESALAKIAQIAGVSAGGPVVGGPKNSRNFVFATISPEKKPKQAEPVQAKKKRVSALEVTPPLAKKPRFSGPGQSRGRRLLDLLKL